MTTPASPTNGIGLAVDGILVVPLELGSELDVELVLDDDVDGEWAGSVGVCAAGVSADGAWADGADWYEPDDGDVDELVEDPVCDCANAVAAISASANARNHRLRFMLVLLPVRGAERSLGERGPCRGA
jgi:hypothetical protein